MLHYFPCQPNRSSVNRFGPSSEFDSVFDNMSHHPNLWVLTLLSSGGSVQVRLIGSAKDWLTGSVLLRLTLRFGQSSEFGLVLV